MSYIRKRIISTKGRVTRIKRLTAANKRAAKLYNSGAYPQSTYGYQATGMAPSQLSEVRAMAAASVSTDVRGQCATTNIWLHLGPRHDPAIKMPLEQIKMWFHILGRSDLSELSRAWWSAKLDLSRAEHEWSMIKGPMGATIGTLRDAGWNPVTALKWVDPWRQEWKIKPGGSLTSFYYEFKKTLEDKVWREAAKHALAAFPYRMH